MDINNHSLKLEKEKKRQLLFSNWLIIVVLPLKGLPSNANLIGNSGKSALFDSVCIEERNKKCQRITLNNFNEISIY